MLRDIALFGAMILSLATLAGGCFALASQREPQGEKYTMVVEEESGDAENEREVVLIREWTPNTGTFYGAFVFAAFMGVIGLLSKIAATLGRDPTTETKNSKSRAE